MIFIVKKFRTGECLRPVFHPSDNSCTVVSYQRGRISVSPGLSIVCVPSEREGRVGRERFILQVGRLGPREGQTLAQSHIANKGARGQ